MQGGRRQSVRKKFQLESLSGRQFLVQSCAFVAQVNAWSSASAGLTIRNRVFQPLFLPSSTERSQLLSDKLVS